MVVRAADAASPELYGVRRDRREDLRCRRDGRRDRKAARLLRAIRSGPERVELAAAGAGGVQRGSRRELRRPVWVTGGNTVEGGGRQVWSYDMAAGRWRTEAPLPAKRTNHAAVAFEGKLYVIGGLDPFNPTRTVFVYDPTTRRWTQSTPLPMALQAHSASVFREEIWVFGGRVRSLERQRAVSIYNPETKKWRDGPALPEPMDTLATSVNGDRIDAIVDEEYFIYDGDKGEWKRGPTLQVPRHALAVYTVDDTLYAVGGCIFPILRDSTIVEKIPAKA